MGDDLVSNRELQEQIREIGLHSDEAVELMRSVMSDTAREAKVIAPHRTGRMAAGIRWSVSDSAGGISGKVSAPAPANLLSTAKGVRRQTVAWGRHLFEPILHTAHNPFLRTAFHATASLYGDDSG